MLVNGSCISVFQIKNPIGNLPLTLSKVSAGTIKSERSLGVKCFLNSMKAGPCRIFNFENSARTAPRSSSLTRIKNCVNSSRPAVPNLSMYLWCIMDLFTPFFPVVLVADWWLDTSA